MQKITGSLVDIHTKQIFPASIEINDDGKIQRIQKDLSILSVTLNEAKKYPTFYAVLLILIYMKNQVF